MKKSHHIYRRRRAAAALFVAVAAGLYTVAPADAGRPTEYHTVAPGETLWSIAVQYYPPSEDPREKIEAIRRANGLGGYRLQAGERLELPSAET